MIPPMIPPIMTDVMPLETESGADIRVSCVVADDVLGVSGVVDVDVLPACGVVIAGDVTEAQSAEKGSSGIACVVTVTVAAVVDGSRNLAETSGHESSFSSVHINFHCDFELLIMFMASYSNYRRNSYLIPPEK